MNTENKKGSFLAKEGVQSLIASLICILLGLLVGYIVLLFINAQGAGRAIISILKNFLYFPKPAVALEYFGSTLAKMAPLLMCTLSILFAYKVGLFNIGASGQYAVGAGLSLFLALKFQMPWYVCLLAAMVGGGILGGISGALKAYLNVNEVIAGIMLNWISLYCVNMLLTNVKESSTTYTLALRTNAPGGLLPHAGLDKLFSDVTALYRLDSHGGVSAGGKADLGPLPRTAVLLLAALALAWAGIGCWYLHEKRREKRGA